MRVFISTPLSTTFERAITDALEEHLRTLNATTVRGSQETSNSNARKSLDDCDIVITVLSQPSMNSAYEIGYAVASNKPALLLVRRGFKLPLLLSGVLYHEIDPDQHDIRVQVSAAVTQITKHLRFSVRSVSAFSYSEEAKRFRQHLASRPRGERWTNTVLEQLATEVFQEMGYRIRRAPALDAGYDFVAIDPQGLESVVEVKHRPSGTPISLVDVRQLSSTAKDLGVRRAILSSTGSITDAAIRAAAAASPTVELWPLFEN
ncbi:MAG: hypothetical protein DHS20C15_24310 [Planctomycetota bacterium]|nr:MAG: hypothetical protein DHS20C15_24310 [Planctomycetota bacterium]